MVKLSVNEQVDDLPHSQPERNSGLTQPIGAIPAVITGSIVIGILLIFGAEVLTVSVGVIPGVLMYCALLFGFVTLSYFISQERAREIFLALTLLPLMRIMSLVLIVPRLLPSLQYVLIGLPVMVTALAMNRSLNAQPSGIHLTKTGRVWQVVFAFSGIPLGVAAYLFLPSISQLVLPTGGSSVLLTWISLTIFGSVAEEIVFRGVVQRTLSASFGSFSVLASSFLYASMFIGTLSVPVVVFYFLIGLLFGFWARVTKSITGTILAHVVLNMVMFALLTTIH